MHTPGRGTSPPGWKWFETGLKLIQILGLKGCSAGVMFNLLAVSFFFGAFGYSTIVVHDFAGTRAISFRASMNQ